VIQHRSPPQSTLLEQVFEDLFRWPALPPPRLSANVYESVDGDAYVVEIAVPGLELDEITLEAAPDGLTVATRPSADESRAQRRYVQQERPSGPTSRVIDFPVEIDADRIRATLDHGILKIEAPKAGASPRRVIPLQKSA
jgi:HSP20 family protein